MRVEAIVVGSLGSWDPKNCICSKHSTSISWNNCICSKKYMQLMRNLIVSDTLRSSRNIYTEFITGMKQSDQQFGGASHNGRTQNIPVADNAVAAPVISTENDSAE